MHFLIVVVVIGDLIICEMHSIICTKQYQGISFSYFEKVIHVDTLSLGTRLIFAYAPKGRFDKVIQCYFALPYLPKITLIYIRRFFV